MRRLNAQELLARVTSNRFPVYFACIACGGCCRELPCCVHMSTVSS